MTGYTKPQTSAPLMLNYLVILPTPRQTSYHCSPLKVSNCVFEHSSNRGKWGQPNQANLMYIIGKKTSFKKKKIVSCDLAMLQNTREI